MPQSEHFGAELGVGVGADDDEVSDEADELVGQAEKHGGRMVHDPSDDPWAVRWVDPRFTPGGLGKPRFELTATGVRHTPLAGPNPARAVTLTLGFTPQAATARMVGRQCSSAVACYLGSSTTTGISRSVLR